MAVWLGFRVDMKREVFTSAEMPTTESHGHLYAAVVGPFKTSRGARFMRDCGINNPHCVTVDDAERLAKSSTSKERT